MSPTSYLAALPRARRYRECSSARALLSIIRGRGFAALDSTQAMTEGGRENRLARESSPYLLLHARNPVDWYPWGEEALARARAEDKPILLSIGYSACHWCP